jgi:hypothetical protein
MSGKVLQLSPRASTRATRRTIAVRDSRSAPAACALDMGFLGCWIESEADHDESSAPDCINWGAISGLALAIAISASCWAGVVWLVERAWR